MIAVWVVMVLSAIGVAGTGFFGCFNSGMNGENAALQVEVLTVDGKPVTYGQVAGQVDTFMRQIGGQSDPEFDFQITSSILGAVIDQQLMANMAAERGIQVEESEVMAGESERIDADIRSLRLQYVSQGELKESATEAEFQKHFEETTGQTTAEYKQQRLDQIEEQLKDPAFRRAIFDNYAMQELQKSFFDSATATEEEVRRSYQNLMLLRITFDNQDKSLEERTVEANQALAELKAGRDFLAVQKKYMKNPITEPAQFRVTDVEANPALKPLASLKPGQYSAVITEFGIPNIYKLVEIKSDAPDDLSTNLSVYSETVRREKANKALQEAVDKARKGAKVVWKSKGYGNIYEVSQLRLHEGMTEAQAKERLIAIMKDDLPPTDDPAGPRPFVIARYAAMRQLDPQLTADERKEHLQSFADVVVATLDHYESASLRLQLVDLHLELGQNEEAAQQLLTAAENNSGFEPANADNFSLINAKLSAMEAAEKISDEDALAIRDVLVRWNEEKNKAEEEAKKAQEELEKFNIDPQTGKTNEEKASETANKAIEEANKTTGGQGN